MSDRIALGTVQFGLEYGVANDFGQVSPDEVRALLSLAKSNRVDVLDTAVAYGVSEEVLGEVGVNDFKIVTKLPMLPEDLENTFCSVVQHVNESLRRLKVKSLYGFLLHRPLDLLRPNSHELVRALRYLKAVGVIQKIGVSIYNPSELDEVRKIINVDLVQTPLSVIDRRIETSDWLSRLKNDGIEIHARSVFLQGLLLMERNEIPKKFSRWSSLWDKWHQRLEELNVSALEACLAYPLSLEAIDKVVVGVDNRRQFESIIKAATATEYQLDFSFMTSTDMDLINPSRWNYL